MHTMCAVGYSSLNPQYPALRSFNRLEKWISIPGHGRSTEFVARQWLHVSNWLSTCASQAIIIVADDDHQSTRLTMCLVVDNVYRSQLS